MTLQINLRQKILKNSYFSSNGTKPIPFGSKSKRKMISTILSHQNLKSNANLVPSFTFKRNGNIFLFVCGSARKKKSLPKALSGNSTAIWRLSASWGPNMGSLKPPTNISTLSKRGRPQLCRELYSQRNLFEILSSQTQIRLYLQFSN